MSERRRDPERRAEPRPRRPGDDSAPMGVYGVVAGGGGANLGGAAVGGVSLRGFRRGACQQEVVFHGGEDVRTVRDVQGLRQNLVTRVRHLSIKGQREGLMS